MRAQSSASPLGPHRSTRRVRTAETGSFRPANTPECGHLPLLPSCLSHAEPPLSRSRSETDIEAGHRAPASRRPLGLAGSRTSTLLPDTEPLGRTRPACSLERRRTPRRFGCRWRRRNGGRASAPGRTRQPRKDMGTVTQGDHADDSAHWYHILALAFS